MIRPAGIGRQAPHASPRYAGAGARPWELAAIILLLVVYEIASDPAGSRNYDVINIAGPIWLGAALLMGAIQIARRVPDGVWLPLFWFRVGTVVYFCGGSLVPVFGSEASQASLTELFAFDASLLFKLNLITAWSAFLVLATSACIDALFFQNSPSIVAHDRSGDNSDKSRMLPIALGFLAIGMALKYLVIFPNLMGWTEIVVPGALVSLADATLVAIYLLTIWSFSGARKYLPYVVALILFEMAMGLLMFNKSAVLFPIIVFSLGLLKQGVTPLRAGLSVAAFAISFVVLQPLVAHARIVQGMQFGNPTSGSLEQRWQMLRSYFDPASERFETEVQTTITRFSYTNVATFVIDRYDRGQPGDSLRGVFALLIPRALWPEKPVFAPGADMAFLFAGQIGNSISAGLFAECYWNFGWLGLPLLLIPWSVILTLASRFTVRVMQDRDWIYLPASFLALRMGSRVDGLYINDVVGATAILVATAFGLGLAGRIFYLSSSTWQRGRH